MRGAADAQCGLGFKRLRIDDGNRVTERIDGEQRPGLEIVSHGSGIDADLDSLGGLVIGIKRVDHVALTGGGVEKFGSGIENHSGGGGLNTGEGLGETLSRYGGTDVYDIESAEGRGCPIDEQRGNYGEAAVIGAAIGIDGYGDRILIDGNDMGDNRGYGSGGEGS